MEKLFLSWKDVYQRLEENLPKDGVPYGIPRGGAIVAGLTKWATDDIKTADYLVDDIIDSGDTKKKWEEKTGLKLYALVDKKKEKIHQWVVFPWEIFDLGAEEIIVRQLEFIGEDPKREGLLDTPKRVVRSWQQLFCGYDKDPVTVLKAQFNKEKYDQMVVLKDIEFFSTCEHHMLPFFGSIKVAYLPDKKVVGISKLARLVEIFSRRLQIQERMTTQIAHTLNDELKPLGVGVVVTAKHLCMVARGVQKQNSIMTTSCLLGAFQQGATREEFLNL